MRRLCSVLFFGCLMGSVVIESVEKSIPIQTRVARYGAWATTTALFGGIMLGIQQLGEDSISYLISLLPLFHGLSDTKFPRMVSGVVAIPAVAYLYTSYQQLVWYFSYIIYSGKQVSPIIAREIAQHLDSYVRCMEMIRDTHKQLDELIAKAESCVSGSGKEQAIRLIGDSIAAAFEHELADAQTHLDKVRQQLEKLGLIQTCKMYSASGGNVAYALDLSNLRGFEHPDFSKIDIETLDRLIKNILDYWHTYLTSLAESLDKRLILCQQVQVLENFISGVLNRPLFPAFEQEVVPTPTVKSLFLDAV